MRSYLNVSVREVTLLGLGRVAVLGVRLVVCGFICFWIFVFVVKLFLSGFLFSLFSGGVFFLLFYLTFLGVFKALDHEDLDNLEVMFGSLKFVGWLFRLALHYVELVGRVKV